MEASANRHGRDARHDVHSPFPSPLFLVPAFVFFLQRSRVTYHAPRHAVISRMNTTRDRPPTL
jgi:hypothetical protein